MDVSQEKINEAVKFGNDRDITLFLIEQAARTLEKLDKNRERIEK